MDPQENKDTVLRWIDQYPKAAARALETGDPSELASVFTEDAFVVWPESDPRGGEHRGLPAILAFLQQSPDLFEPGTRKVEVISMIAERDQVAALMHVTGRSSKGRDYNGLYHCLYRVRGGKVSEVWDFKDSMHSYQVFYAD
jgi:ketosteroid isomerase-like protein